MALAGLTSAGGAVAEADGGPDVEQKSDSEFFLLGLVVVDCITSLKTNISPKN